MREPDDKLGPLALSILAAGHVVDMRDTACEHASLRRAAARPIPILPIDPVEREGVLTLLLLRERDYFHRALALVECLIGLDQAA